jgi:hypothetical protein
MQRCPLLLLAAIVLATLARAWVDPVWVGAPDPDQAQARAAFGLTRPFGDDLKGSSDALHSLLAQSLRREGLAATGGWPLLNPTDVEPADYFYYDHHPPGVSLLTAAAFALLGPHEGVARGVALLFATIALLAVAALARRAAGDGVAAFTVVALAATPGGLYWATHLDYPVPTMAACACFLALAASDDAPRRARTCAIGVALAVALGLDFLAVLAPAALFVDRLAFGPRGAKRLLGWPAIGAGVVAAIVAWKQWQLARHGHGDGLTLEGNVAQIWSLPEGVALADWWRAVERHLRALVGPLGEGVIAFGIVRALLPGRDGPLCRFVRMSTLLALGAGLLPRLRAWDHAYFQLYWLLPLGGSAALLGRALLAVPAARATPDAASRAPAGAPSADWRRKAAALFAAMVAGAFLIDGACSLPRSTIDASRPSAHRLGRELAAKLPDDARLVLLPAGVPLDVITLCWYARRMVATAPGDPPDRARAVPYLAPFGLADAPAWWAPGVAWPGREGVRPLQ